MSSQILRPTLVKRDKTEWVIHGSWGKKKYTPMTKVDLYSKLHKELIASGVLSHDSPLPSNRHHSHVTLAVMNCSWLGEKWIPDESFAARLKRLREGKGLTQEALAKKADLDVGTIRQLEQGTRINPQWHTVAALVRGFEAEVTIFVGTERHTPPEGPNSHF